MKQILILHTGGTIGSASRATERAMNADTVQNAKRLLLTNFAESASKYAGCAERLVDARFPENRTTLSESMYPEKLMEIASYLKAMDLEPYDGIIVLHGTDTLAFTASLFSFLYTDLRIPMILVSGDHPPDDARSNANDNFKTAVELIWEGLAPNVYAVYRNSDRIVRLFLGSTLMQCPNYSGDFRSASSKNTFELVNSADRPLFEVRKSEKLDGEIFDMCNLLSNRRNRDANAPATRITAMSDRVLLLYPHTGLNYSGYAHAVEAQAYRGVVHGTYHSGTVSLPGLVSLTMADKLEKEANARAAQHLPPDEHLAEEIRELKNTARAEMTSAYSVLSLASKCREQNIPLYIAPSQLGKDQYETMAVVKREGHAILLNMTTEAAYAKLTVALSCGLEGDALDTYMQTDICNEMQD